MSKAAAAAIGAGVLVLLALGSRAGTEPTQVAPSGEAPTTPRSATASDSPRAETLPSTVEDATGDAEGVLVTSELNDPETLARLERIASHTVTLAQRPTFDEVFKQGYAKGPIDLAIALENHLRDQPQDASRLLEAMSTERDSKLLFAMARALGRVVADPGVRQATLSLLREMEADRQEVALVALLGRREAEVLSFLFDRLETGDTDGVRARAASLLAHVIADLEPADAERAQTVARSLLTSVGTSPPLTAAAAEVLGAPNAQPADVVLLRQTLDRSADGATYSSVAQSLAATGLEPKQVLDLFRATIDDTSAPAEVREIATTLLASVEANR